VRLGIRAQLVLALAALLVLGFAPLFFAVSELARASLLASWRQHARGLGRAVAAHVSEARRGRSTDDMVPLLEAQLGEGVVAVGVYDEGGRLARQASVPGTALPASVEPGREDLREQDKSGGPELVVVVPGGTGPVAVLLRGDPSVVRVTPLVRLTAIYFGLLGLGLLIITYLVLTRLVVAPIEKLSHAAERVAEGGRSLAVPRAGARELLELGESLAKMTAALRAEEEELGRRVTELKAATDEIRRTQEIVVKSERLASVGRLAAGLAHEIGNPITAILAFQDLLLEGELDGEQRDFVERMKRETERVSKILRDLLDFARPAARSAPESDAGAHASVRDAVDHVLALVKPQKAFHDVDVAATVPRDLPAVAIGAERLEQVLLNLLLNAADVVPRPGGRIRVEARAANGAVELAVEDNGGGIAEAIRDRLFEPFATTKDVGKGTGLGLAVCRGLVEAAGGRIDAREGAEGARFVLELPAHPGSG
jgi:two-component system, NtrC family, sensor kinase